MRKSIWLAENVGVLMENIDIKYYDIEELGTWPIYLSDIEAVSEGEQKLSQHLKRERNLTIVRKAKERFRERNNGRLFCEICKFDFSERYGEIGEGFIEAHHKKPISKMKTGDLTKIEDFIMVCSNCHRMIHTGNDCMTPEELKLRLKT